MSKKKKIIKTIAKGKVSEPSIKYGEKEISFFNSFTEMEEDNYKWLASLSPEQHLHNATELIKRIFSKELNKKNNSTKIYFS